MKLSEKLKELKRAYVEKMPNKALLEVEHVEDPSNEEQESLYWELPECCITHEQGEPMLVKLVFYKDGILYAYDGEGSYWLSFDLSDDDQLQCFSLEVLAEFNEFYE